MKVNQNQWYSLLEVQKLTGIKSRQYLAKYINEGKLLAIQTGVSGTRIRYSILGSWVSDFIKRYKNGEVKGRQYSKEEVVARLRIEIDRIESEKNYGS